ncbi:MAG: cytochrome c family protein [Deltaproteobacteria bacterium]|nr:cytochrome c family protein [Deltaproteobacteria bacterium]
MDRFRMFFPGLIKVKGMTLFQFFMVSIIASSLFLPIYTRPAWCEDSSSSSDWFIDMNRFSKSAHGSLKCDRCHGEMTLKGNVHPNRKDPTAIRKDSVRTYDYKRCATCHPESYKRYLMGEHAKVLAKQEEGRLAGGKPAPPERLAPTCGDCHSSHYAQAKLSRITMGEQMILTCGKCHVSQKMSYLKNLHGQLGVFLEKKASAYCTDCHGAHTCESLKAKEKALTACRRCHRNASTRFADIVIHTGSEDISKKDPKKQVHMALILTIKRIGQIVTVLVLAFFALQTFVWILRELHNRLRGR